MVRWKRLILFSAVALSLQTAPSMPQGARGAPKAADSRPDYAAMRREIMSFSSVVDKTISAAFNGAPFALKQETKGVYLQGYGVAFSFIVNIHRALVTPFGTVQSEQITPEQKRRRIEDLKEKLSRVMLENAENLRQIRTDDTVTIVCYFEDHNFPDEQNQNKTVVLSVLKKDLEEVSRKEDRWKEFKQRMKAVEY
jgi:hypothetical protein